MRPSRPAKCSEIENFAAAAEKAGPEQHMESFSRRTAKIEKTCEKQGKCVCFAIEPLKKNCENLAKSL